MGWWCMKPPLADSPREFKRIRMEGTCSNPTIKNPLVHELDRFKLIDEVMIRRVMPFHESNPQFEFH